jgi:hypothetical protein
MWSLLGDILSEYQREEQGCERLRQSRKINAVDEGDRAM